VQELILGWRNFPDQLNAKTLVLDLTRERDLTYYKNRKEGKGKWLADLIGKKC
jgi:hypothetical protein